MSVRVLSDPAPQAKVSLPAQTSIGTTAALVLAANAKRKGLMIQNTGTTTIKLTFDGTNPTQSVYQVALAASSVADDGKGASYFDDACVTEVRAISSGAGGIMVITEFNTGSPDWDLASDLGVR